MFSNKIKLLYLYSFFYLFKNDLLEHFGFEWQIFFDTLFYIIQRLLSNIYYETLICVEKINHIIMMIFFTLKKVQIDMKNCDLWF